MNLSGKVLAITGSDGALGQAAAATLSGYGATLALLEHGHTPTTAQPAGARHYGGIDLTQEDAARSVMERVVKEAGRLDGLINIAGGFHFEKLAGGCIESICEPPSSHVRRLCPSYCNPAAEGSSMWVRWVPSRPRPEWARTRHPRRVSQN